MVLKCHLCLEIKMNFFFLILGSNDINQTSKVYELFLYTLLLNVVIISGAPPHNFHGQNTTPFQAIARIY